MSRRPVAGRRGARRLALEALYAREAEGEADFQGWGEHLDTGAREYAHRLWTGVRDNMPDLDAQLAACCQGWAYDRLGRVERNILRLALYEIGWEKQVPAVAINEAVELAKEFGGERSGSFVNGVLMQAVRQLPGRDEE